MLKALLNAAAAVCAVLCLLTHGRDGKRRCEAAEPRRAEPRAQIHAMAAPQALARIASLWSAQGLALCRIPASYGLADAAHAQFSPVLRLRLQAAAPSLRVREQLVLTAANDADFASALAGPEPAVKLVKAARFKPRRAIMGDVEAALAA